MELTLTCVRCRGLREDPADELELREAAEFDGTGVDEDDMADMGGDDRRRGDGRSGILG